MKLFLIRHGQTTGDIEDRYGGDYDDHLTDLGKQQSQKLAEKLENKNIEKIFCSPKIRAQETASILNEKIQCEIETYQNIRERNRYGILTGMTKREAKEKYPELVKEVSGKFTTIDGAEPFEDFKKRIATAWQKLLSSPQQTIAVVTHGGPLWMLFREILEIGEATVEDCGYAELDIANNQIKIINIDGIKIEEI